MAKKLKGYYPSQRERAAVKAERAAGGEESKGKERRRQAVGKNPGSMSKREQRHRRRRAKRGYKR